MVFELSKYAKVFISSEGVLPDDLKHYQLNLPADKIHDILAYASLFIGEGATMVSECAMLGIPAIYVNSLELGYCTELEKKYGLVFNFRKPMGVLDKAIELFQQKNLSIIFQKRKNKMLSDKINVTEFFVWFIENYPFSVSIIKK